VKFSRELISTAWNEISGLWHGHNEEVGTFGSHKLEPNKEMYEQLEKSGVIHFFTMRHDSMLVGYCSMLMFPHHHYRGTVCANQDALYVLPEWRGFASVKFLRFIDSELFKSGADKITRQVTVKKDFSRTLERMGYEAKEVVYTRSV
jgi:hypothetical protein